MPMSAEIMNRAQSRLGMVLNGKWRLDEILGVGGMATVYAAMHRNQKRVAVKMLHTELSLEEGVRTRFLREGYLANTVDHPSAVTVFDDDIAEDGSAFLVMELLEGETIHDRIMREGRLPVADVLRMGDEVLDVLVAAHTKRIIHRDLKPENLFITRDGHVKVLDFGIARLRELTIGSPSSTASGFFMGTPAFMAPEHARGKWSEVDAPSDLWSVGATLFTMLTGKFVHDSDTAMDTLVMAVTRRAPPIRSVMPELDSDVAALIDRSLAFEKEDRWSSAVEMQAALRESAARLFSGRVLAGPSGEERSPATPTFASPPYSPQRVYQATVRSAGPPALAPRVTSDAPTSASLVPLPTRSEEPRRQRSGSGVSVTERGGGASPPRRKATTWVVAGASLLLLGLGGASLVRQSRPPALGSSADVVEAVEVPPPTGVELPLTVDDALARNATVRSAGPIQHLDRPTALPGAAPTALPQAGAAVAPHVGRSGARARESVAAHVDAGAASAPSLALPVSTPAELAPPANTNPFDRRY